LPASDYGPKDTMMISMFLVLSYLHCPLKVSQFTSGLTMPGREQLQTSHPTSGWQPNVWGSHWVHSGSTVLGGQIQSPVTGSHNLVPQLQAGGKERVELVPGRKESIRRQIALIA